MLQKAI